MTPCIEEARRLLRLAERDGRTFRILRAHPEAELAPTCIHAQQAVEKALKAVDFCRTHDLEELANLLLDLRMQLPFSPREFRRLNPYAVEFRYDDTGLVLLTGDEAERIVSHTLAWALNFVTDAENCS
jgi:HEPN domain-containing protein